MQDLLPSWRRSLAAEGKSPRTIESYIEGATRLVRFLEEHGFPTEIDRINRGHVEEWLVAFSSSGRAPATVANRSRSARLFFTWCVDDGEIDESPMAKLRQPKIPPPHTPVLNDTELAALLQDCEGRAFLDVRDRALLRFLIDTGARRGEVLAMTVAGLNLDEGIVAVIGKGGKVRALPFGAKATRELDRYLRTPCPPSAGRAFRTVALAGRSPRPWWAQLDCCHAFGARPGPQGSPAPVPAFLGVSVARFGWF